MSNMKRARYQRPDKRNLKPLEVRVKGNRLTLTLGADDPKHLNDEYADKVAKTIAKRKGFRKNRGRDSVKVFGQNYLAQRTYYYER
ncbi:deaminated base DNA N-glycosylase activity protein [Lysinibacillus phage vB_LfM_LysYB1]|nr:deaminated base DNA N-glycosylase activity protein [Lysinibacillus phage vB_LfM_LysYB1]WAB25412.1 deaminated base DNA N-glycosylase activity protein [Lysinibacillus phage vB_LfM_LysYB2]